MPDGGVTKARTARKPHECASCHWSASLRGIATILPGHRYLVHTALPGYTEGYNGDVPMRLAECTACAVHRGAEWPLSTNTCLRFCHGDIPCARPHNHPCDHSCRRDAEEAVR